MRKKILGVVLTICMLMAFAPCIHAATIVNSGTLGDNLTWTLDAEGTLTVSGEGDIPDMTNSEIPWYELRAGIRSLVIDEGITSIGSYAFNNCRMRTVQIPDSVESIRSYAFRGAAYLTEINISKYVTNIEDGALLNTGALTSITVDSENPVYSITDGKSLVDTQRRMLLAYPCGLKDTSYTVPEDITEIGMGAFYSAANLEEIDLANVYIIGNNAFRYCSSLRDVVCPESVGTIRSSAFVGCTNLTSVTIMNDNIRITTNVFSDNSPVFVLRGNEGSTAQQYAEMNSITFVPIGDDSNLPVLDDGGAFGNDLEWTVHGDTLTISGNGDMPDWTGAAEQPWYDYRENIRKAVVEDGITRIGNYAFATTGIKNIEIPDSVTSIGYNAFEYASRLEEINISKYMTSFGNYVFRSTPSLKSINVDEENEVYKSIDGVLIGRSSAYLLAYPVAKADTSYKVPDEVQTIDRFAFYKAENLKSIDFSNVTRLREYAFVDCVGLTEIVIPESVTQIDNSVFIRCSKLRSASVLNKDAAMGTGIFADCSVDFVLKGYKGSTAETYANTNSVTFEEIRTRTVNDIGIGNVDEDKEGMTITATFSNLIDGNQSFDALCAIYDENNTLIAFKRLRVNALEGNADNAMEFSFDSSWSSFKVFAWDKTDNPQPVAKAVSSEL